MNEQELGKEESIGNMTIYHVPNSIVQDFKTFCRMKSANKFSIGLKLLLDSYKEKESYLYLINEVTNLRADVDKLKTELSSINKEEEDDEVVKTFGFGRN